MSCLRTILIALTVMNLCLIGCTLKKAGSKAENENVFSERDDMEKAMKQEFLMTVDPALGYVPKERLVSALKYERRLMAAREQGINAITWQERGPSNIAGRTRALVIDSRDNTGNTVFAASVSGGIWKTTNFKATNPTWTAINQSMGSLAVCALVQDPSHPDTLYAGTGEGWFNNDAVRGNGIWKSGDGGATWNQIPLTDSGQTTHNFDFIQDLAMTTNGVLFATGRPSVYCNVGGVLRTRNGGFSWSRPIGTLAQGQQCDSAYNFFAADLEVASNGDVYATTGFINSGEITDLGKIWRSRATNGINVGTGGTWLDITPAGTWQRIEMAVAPSNPAIIYALLEGSGDGIGAIKKTVDTGATWTDLQLPTWCNQGSNSADFTNGQAFYDLIVQVDPNNPNTVIIGGIDLFKSTDGGTSWNQITQWARNCSTLPVIHPDQHNVIFFPSSSTELIATNDGGIYYSNTGGTSWATTTQPNLNGANQTTISQKNIGYNVTQLYACDVHPTQTNYFLIGTQDNGSLELTSTGIGIAVEASIGGDGGFCHIDQTDGNLQILSYVYNNFYYSRNGGTSFQRRDFNNSGFFINPSDLDDSKKVLYTSTGPGQLGVVSNLTAGTPSFSTQSISQLGIRKISALRVDPTVSGGGTVWIAGYDSSGSVRPVIIKVNNANTAATAVVSTVLPTTAPVGSFVSSIDVDPANASHILVTLSNYGIISVYESTNGGTSFVNVEGNLPDVPVRWGMFVPSNASVEGTVGSGILLATEIGVWFTQTTSGTTTNWTPQNTGLPNVRTDMLRYRASDNLLAVATHGRGLFTTTLTSIATGVPTVANTKNFIDYVTASRQQVFVKIGNLNITAMEVRLFAADGRLVYSSKAKYANQSIPIAQLPSGSYILKIYGNKNEQFTKQFIK
jgi:hypothetical protein